MSFAELPNCGTTGDVDRPLTWSFADIAFECTTCGQHLVVDSIAVGTLLSCPMCASEVTVPDDSHRTDGTGHRNGTSHGFERDLADALIPEEAPEPDLDQTFESELRALRVERDRAAAAQTQVAADLKQLQVEKAAALSELERERATAAAQKAELEDSWQVSRRRAEALEAHLAVREAEMVERDCSFASLKAEVSLLEETLSRASADLELERAISARKVVLEEEVKELRHRLSTAEREAEALASTRDELQAEVEALRLGLKESQAGREVVALREQFQAAEQARESAVRHQRMAEEECKRALGVEAQLRADRDALLQRCQEAERRADATSETKIEDDREVLRGIVQRQKEEIAQRHAELVRLRRARFGVRLAYALVSLCSLALLAVGFKLVQCAL
jgi:chromosome segregation ATPase